MEKIKDELEKPIYLIISFVSLMLSLVLLILKNLEIISLNPYLDFAWITIILSGYPILFEAIEGLFKDREIKSSLLISIAIIASIVISEMFAAAEVAFIMALGELLEELTINKAKKGIDNLIKITPKYGYVVENNEVVKRDIDEIKASEIVRIFPGDEVPLDGVVLSGTTDINEATLTGEAIPVLKEKGSKVYAGTFNYNGTIDILVESEYKNSSFQKMIDLLNETKTKKAPLQRIADKWASILVPLSCLIAIITTIVTWIIYGNNDNIALIRGVTILVVFCPCALSLATPTSIIAGVGQATKYGVLIKSGEAIENIGRSNVIFFDKTGTITKGVLIVDNVVCTNILNEDEILSIAYSLESLSAHPISEAIINKAKEKGLKPKEIDEINIEAGKGISGIYLNQKYYLGNKLYLEENNIKISDDIIREVNELRLTSKVVIFLSDTEKVLGYISLMDTIKENAKDVISKIKSLGYKTVILSGDDYNTVSNIKNQIGVDDFKANLLPLDKVKIIEKYKKSGYKTVMVGDGLNDALALEVADSSVSMSKIGSDIAIEASDISLLNDDIDKLPYLLLLSNKTINTIKLNIFLSLFVNFVAIILSIFGILDPITGAIVHNVGSLLIILNASLLYERKFIDKIDYS